MTTKNMAENKKEIDSFPNSQTELNSEECPR